MDSGRHTHGRRKLGALLVLIGLLGTLFGTVGLTGASADGGDFSLDFVAAGPGDYDHTTGIGGAFDDRTINKDTGVVESLEGGDFACGDLVVFFTEVTVAADAVGSQSIEVDMSWLAEPTGQPGAGFVDLVSAEANTVANGAEADGDSGHVTDGGEVVTIESETFDTSGPKDQVLATISVTDLEAGETFILRTTVLLGCEIGASPTGNIQSDILAARVVAPTADTISVGNQTIPLKKVEDIAEPSFTVTKVADDDSVNSGETLGFTMTVTNTGNVALEDVTLSDPLPGAGFTWVENPDNPECSIAGSTLTCNFGDILVGGSESVHVQATAVTGVCGPLDNTATAITTNAGSQQASDSVTITCPEIDIEKLASDGIDVDSERSDSETFEAGDVIGFDIIVTNAGDGPATNVVVSDTLPDLPSGADWSINPAVPGCSLSGDDNRVLSCTFASLAPGASITIHVQATTSAADCLDADNSISYPNTAAVTTGNNGSDEDSATVTVNCAAIDIDKTASDGIDLDGAGSDDETFNAGDVVGFDIVVTNTGIATAKNVVVSDTLPDLPSGADWSINPAVPGCSLSGDDNRVLSCTFVTLAAGASVTIHVQAATAAADCGNYDNTASVTTGNDGSDIDSASLTVVCPDVGVTKVADDDVINAGDVAGFTITIENFGDGTATGVELTDALPAGIAWSIDSQTGTGNTCAIAGGALTCGPFSLAAGATASVVISGTTDAADCGVLTNTAIVDADVDTNPDNDESTDTVTVLCPSIGVTKVADDDTVSAGEQIGFTITVINDGPGVAYDVTLDDPLPAGVTWTIESQTGDPDAGCSITAGLLSCGPVDLAVGASFSVHVVADTTEADCALYENTATADASNDAPITASDDTTVQCPDIDVDKIADDDVVTAGDEIGFTITVSNDGPGTAFDVTLNDPLPGGDGIDWVIDGGTGAASCDITGDPGSEVLSCDFDDMAAGASFTVHVTSDTDPTGEVCQAATLVNTATADASNDAPVTADDTTTIQCPDLTAEKVADATSVSAGEQIGFTITIGNNGPGIAYGVTVDDPLPTGVNWTIESQTGDGDCEIAGGTLTCGPVDLADGESFSVHLVADTTEADCALYENTATVDADNDAPLTPSDDTLVKCPGLNITKDADDDLVSAGEQIGFTVEVSNDPGDGVGTAFDVTLDDPLPSGDGIDWEIESQTGGAGCEITGAVGSETLTCGPVDLDPGESFSVHVVSDTDPTGEECEAATLPNTATADASNHAEIEASDTVAIQCPDIGITKVAGADVVDAGDPLVFTVSVTNAGPGDAFGVTVSDPLPAGVTWTEDSDECSIAANTLVCGPFDLGAEDTFTVTLTADTTEADCAVYENTATADADNDGPVTATDTSRVLCPLDIDLDKTGDALAHVGDTVAYEFTVTNTGGEDLLDVTLADPECDEGTITLVDDGDGDDVLAKGTWDGDSFEGGEVWTYTCTRVLTAEDIVVIDGEDFALNLGEVTAHDDTGRETSDEDPHVVEIINPAIQVVKTVDDATPDVGQTVTFTYVVTNTGDTTLFDVLVVDDKLGTIGTIEELAPGDSATLTKTMVVAANSPTQNIATATGSDVLGKKVSDDDPETITIVLAAVAKPPVQVLGQQLPKTGAETRLLLVSASGLILLGGLLLLSTSQPAVARSSRRR